MASIGFGKLKLPAFVIALIFLNFARASICAAQDSSSQTLESRMLGGHLKDIWEGPFAFISIDENEITCSGVLVGPSEVLTAAHCVGGDKERPQGFSPFEYSVAVGGQFFGVTSAFYNSGYKPRAGATVGNAQHDLGMLILNGVVTEAAPLPILSGLEPKAKQIATIFGFGANRSSSTSAFNIFYNAGEQGNTEITAVRSGLIGAKYGKKHAISCAGDSGGGLVQGVGGFNALVGTVSEGTASEKNNACKATLNVTTSTFVDLQSAASKKFLKNFQDIQYFPGKIAVFTAALPPLTNKLSATLNQAKNSKVVSNAKAVVRVLGQLRRYANSERSAMLSSAIASLKQVKASVAIDTNKTFVSAALTQLDNLESLGLS